MPVLIPKLVFCSLIHFTLHKSGGSKGWCVFHHFVGAVPGSTDLLAMLCRLLKELEAVDVSVHLH